jgi:Domain of unknown function (DUF4365)
MATRKRAQPRPKTISATGVTGQKGINLIERVVLDMESHWTPSGPNEVGIDGYIELFDPSSRKALGLTLAAQSKVVSSVGRDASPTFDYWCDPADVEYWTGGSMPVILVVSSPATGDAYWVSVQDYFKSWTRGQPTTVTFTKATQRFTKDSFRDLLNLAAPKAGLYLAPAPKTEKLHSNLLRVEAFPERLYFADTECRWPSEVWALLRKSHRDPDAGWVIKGKRFISFHDLSEEPWTAVCDDGTVESFPTSDWSDSDDVERQHVFVQLLNQTLRAQLHGEARYWSKEECFAFLGTKERKVGYQSLKRHSRITAVSQFSKTGKDGRTFEWLRHIAFRGKFRLLDGQWFLEITPTYRFTRDGFELERFHEDRLKGIKQLEGNRAVLSSVLFWADYLRPRKDLFAGEPPPIRFGELVTFGSPVGVNDRQWLASDPEFGKEAVLQKDSLFLPDLEDIAQ